MIDVSLGGHKNPWPNPAFHLIQKNEQETEVALSVCVRVHRDFLVWYDKNW
ncbi:MAG: hypothetical protein GX354_11590 [Firmicutes bacterium]|jgi:hypothetical protein|nr:hypothetical protein [Bacillota bacterium]